jgi:hypothetical protein
MNHMIDLDENCLDQIAQAAAPLSPLDREAFIDAAIRLLKQEPIFGPGTVNRIVRELLGTGVYRRDAITGVGRPMRGPHDPYDRKGRRGRHGKPPPADDDAA